MKRLAGIMTLSAALALAACGAAEEPAEMDTMEAEPVEVDEAGVADAADPAMEADGDAAETAEGATEGNAMEPMAADSLEEGSEEFDPTGNPIGPGEAQE